MFLHIEETVSSGAFEIALEDLRKAVHVIATETTNSLLVKSNNRSIAFTPTCKTELASGRMAIGFPFRSGATESSMFVMGAPSRRL